MLIMFKWFGRNISISIGYDTTWFQQDSFITVMEEFYGDDMKVEYAKMLFHS